MIHGDDQGLRVPPALAPVQAVVLAVKPETVEAAHRVGDELRAAGVRVRVDDRADVPFGRRAVNWELKGVPVRIEVGPRDVAENQVTLARRLTDEAKRPVRLSAVAATVTAALQADQRTMLEQATAAQDARIAEVATVQEAAEAAATGWARLPWDVVGEEGEDRLAQSAATVRCLQRADGTVPERDDEPDLVAFVARSY